MPLRIRIRFKPEQRSEINLFFKKEMERARKCSKELQKPLGRMNRWVIERQMKKHKIEKVEYDEAIKKMQKGYEFNAFFVNDTEALMEWKGHFLIDYNDIAGELLAKSLFPMFFGMFKLTSLRGREMINTFRSAGFKKALKDSIANPNQVRDRVKEALFLEEQKRFKAIGAKVEVEI